MGLPAENQIVSFNDLKKRRRTLYFAFAFLSIVLIFLAIFQVGYLGFLIPALLLIAAYSKNLKWVDMLKVYFAILFLVPIASYELFGGLFIDIEPNRVFAALLLAIWLPLLLVDPTVKIRRTGLEGPLFLLAVSLMISMVINMDSYSYSELTRAIKSILLFASYIFVFYLVVSVLRNYGEIEAMVKWLVFLAIFISLFGIAERFTDYNLFKRLHEFLPFLKQKFSGQQEEIKMMRGALRISGPADHPISLAALLAMFMPLIFFFFNKSKYLLKKCWYGAGLAVTLIAALFTVSATALVGIITALGSQLFTNPRKGLGFFLAIALFILCSSLIFYNDYEHLAERISYDYLVQNEIGNEHGRLVDYPRVWQELLQRPLFGRGFGTFDPKESRGHFALILDNQYLGFLIEIGLIGTLCFIWFFFSLIKKLGTLAVRSNGSQSLLAGTLLSSVVAFVVMCFTFDTFGFPQVVYAFFILAGLGTALALSDERRERGL